MSFKVEGSLRQSPTHISPPDIWLPLGLNFVFFHLVLLSPCLSLKFCLLRNSRPRDRKWIGIDEDFHNDKPWRPLIYTLDYHRYRRNTSTYNTSSSSVHCRPPLRLPPQSHPSSSSGSNTISTPRPQRSNNMDGSYHMSGSSSITELDLSKCHPRMVDRTINAVPGLKTSAGEWTYLISVFSSITRERRPLDRVTISSSVEVWLLGPKFYRLGLDFLARPEVR